MRSVPYEEQIVRKRMHVERVLRDISKQTAKESSNRLPEWLSLLRQNQRFSSHKQSDDKSLTTQTADEINPADNTSATDSTAANSPRGPPMCCTLAEMRKVTNHDRYYFLLFDILRFLLLKRNTQVSK